MKRFFAMVSVLLLAACSAPPAPTIGLSDLAKYRLAGVEVQGEGVVHSWPAEEKAFLASGRGDPDMARRLDTEPASNFPTLRADIKQALERRLYAALQKDGGVLFTGARPIVAQVTVLAFDVPSVGRRLIAGGSAVVQLKIDLVDPSTHQVLTSYPGQPASVPLTSGAIGVIAASLNDDDVGEELIQKAAALYVAWLKGKGEVSM